MLVQHLLDNNTYRQLNKGEAETIQNNFTNETQKLLQDYEGDLFFAEIQFFQKGLRKLDRMAQMYGMPKVHKEKTDGITPFRPVTSQCGSFASLVSKYLDYYLQKLVKLVPSYVKNSSEVLQRIRDLNLSNTYLLFTSDA